MRPGILSALQVGGTIFQSALLLGLSASPALAFPQDIKAKGNCWKQLAPIQGGPRQEHGVAALNNNIYIVAGMKQNTSAGDSTAEVYNVDSNKWANVSSLPKAVHHPNVAGVNGKVYVLGALAGTSTGRVPISNTYKYDPVANKWEELAPMPARTGRGASAVVVRGSLIYLIGGLQPLPETRFNAVDLVSSYDTDTGKWTELPKLPEARDHFGGAFIGDTLYAIGGRVGNPMDPRGTVFALNSTSSSWVKLANMPTPRGGISVAAIGTKIYTFGGEGNRAPTSNGVFSECESYDASRDAWTKEVTMKTPRHGMGAVTIGGAIYLPGGGSQGGGGTPLDTNEAFIPGNC